MIDTRDRYDAVFSGRMAEIIFAHIGSRIGKAKEMQIQRMESAFRSGKIDSTDLVSGIAGYCALKDFETNLINEVKRGNHALKEEHVIPDDTNQ